MSVFIANFGRENYEWPHCLKRGTIATMNDVGVHGFWEQGEREAYIQEQMKGKTWAGITPPKQVASRWFNLMTIVSQSSGDIWDLRPWHNHPSWIQKIDSTKGKYSPVTFFDARNLEIARMAKTAFTTTQASNGQEASRIVKNKNFGFNSEYELENYIRGLLNIQDNLCALTEIPLQFGNDCEDPQMRCSLDRIDSQGHYEAGNLQIVCKFANQWKSDRDNEEFKRLIGTVRSIGVF